jgi:hypothetical protein
VYPYVILNAFEKSMDIINQWGKNSAHLTKRRPRRKIKTDEDDFDKHVIRRKINEFNIAEGESPTLKSLLAVLKKKFNFSGGKWALWNITGDSCFTWRKSESNRKVLIEQDNIGAARLAYLRNISRYITYMMEN